MSFVAGMLESDGQPSLADLLHDAMREPLERLQQAMKTAIADAIREPLAELARTLEEVGAEAMRSAAAVEPARVRLADEPGDYRNN